MWPTNSGPLGSQSAPVSPDGRWWWDGQRWQPILNRTHWPIPPVSINRVPRWLRVAALALSISFIGIIVVRVGDWTLPAAVVIFVAMLAVIVLATPHRRDGERAAIDSAWQGVAHEGEVERGSAYVYIGTRPAITYIALVSWVAYSVLRLVRREGGLVITDRRVLLFGTDDFHRRIDRLLGVDSIASIQVLTYTAGPLHSHLVLAWRGQPFEMMAATRWKAGLAQVVAAIEATSQQLSDDDARPIER